MRLFVCFFLLIPVLALCQDSTARHDRPFKGFSVRSEDVRTPALLIGAGLIAATDNEVFDKWEIYEVRNKMFPHFHTHADNYIQFAPIVAVYALGAFGLKGQHNVLNQTALIVKSEILMGAVVFALKRLSAVDRPGTETDSSFPSGHTAQAFAAATILHREFGTDHPWISVLGYTAAGGVGILRVLNSKHWISDVLVGAGVGILSTNLVCATHQNKWGSKSNRVMTKLSPFYQQHAAGFCLNLVIK